VKVRTRFAPSPTGRLHIGGVRTALFNYLFAKKQGGSFILRIEDTDRARSRPEFEESIKKDMRWLGLSWDEGPETANGGHGPYRQSERVHIYRELANKLLKKNLAYRCYCSVDRLKKLNEEQAKAGAPPRYDGACRGLTTAPPNIRPVLRFIVPDKEIHFTDLIHGPRVFNPRAFGDFIILTPDGEPTYNFASAVDDGLMEISHVLRGDDHPSNTPRQILIMEALGLRPPSYAHMPLVLGPNRRPLSKRDEGVGIEELREKGFLPTALLNAAARLGWAPGEDLLTLPAMAAAFSLKKISKSPAIFDSALIYRFNKRVIRELDAKNIIELADLKGLSEDKNRLFEAALAVRGTAESLGDFSSLMAPLLRRPAITDEAASILNTPEAEALLEAVAKELDNGIDTYNALITETKAKTGFKGRALFMPIRCALTGTLKGIELEVIFNILGAEEVSNRIKRALATKKTRQ